MRLAASVAETLEGLTETFGWIVVCLGAGFAFYVLGEMAANWGSIFR